MVVEFTTTMFVAEAPPMFTLMSLPVFTNPEPVIVISVPPSIGPELGETLVTASVVALAKLAPPTCKPNTAIDARRN